MSMAILERIILRFPRQDDPFPRLFSQWLQVLGKERETGLELNSPGIDLFPKVQLDFRAENLSGVRVDFLLSNGETVAIDVENTNGESRKSPHFYTPLPIEQALQRLTEHGITLAGADHIGCNLPWFAGGYHPKVRVLRENLCRACLYHRFPTGEAWDFILPGTVEEIDGQEPINYSRTRRPKFEIVSFEKASTPLVQLDLQLTASYELLSELFPEALNDPELSNLWIYLMNPYGIDVCIVANAASGGDWSDFFNGCRIV
jgi:hypothetical protein